MFQTIQKDNLIILQSDILGRGIRHGFSTRPGGVSPAPWDSLNLDERRSGEPENVQKNFMLLCDALDMDVRKVVHSKQVHRDDVRIVTTEDWGKGLWHPADYDSADALITNIPGTVLTVFSADCNVILLHDPVHKVIGAVHAGWRGTALGLVGKTVREMARVFGSAPSNIRAAIGPAIGQCCFETDEDVPLAMKDALGYSVLPYMEKRGNKWHLDLKAINALWLKTAGVTQIDTCELCTYCHPELFWSHRRTGLARGEQGALIALEDKAL